MLNCLELGEIFDYFLFVMFLVNEICMSFIFILIVNAKNNPIVCINCFD